MDKIDILSFNSAFAGAFAGTVAAIAFVFLVRYANSFARQDEIPAWLLLAIAGPLVLAMAAMYSVLS